MATHEDRLQRMENDIYEPDKGIKDCVKANSIGYIRLNAKMTAILWMFGILIAILGYSVWRFVG